ncbi:MAG: hypothetical protein KAU21_09170, partial [Gammaproteobacteria bacterium]|nr:hypothetical protein [Gammaproteobacteria bacterium]
MAKNTTVHQFVEAIAEYINLGNNGTMVLMGQNDAWGKAIIENNELVSIMYGIYRGKDALQQISQLSSIRFMFRPEKKDEVSAQGNKGYANAGSARMSSEEFFAYFDFDFTFFRHGEAP